MLVNTHAGPPVKLNEKIIERILDAIPRVYSYNQIAGLCKVEPSTLRKWIYRGKREHLEGKESIFVELFLKFFEKKAQCAEELIHDMRSDKDNFKATSFLLERAYKKDFGSAHDEQRHFYGLIVAKLSKAGIKLEDYDDFMEDAELQGDHDGKEGS